MANPKIVLDGDATGAVAAVKRLSKELGSLEGLATKAFNFAVAGYSISSLVSLTKSVVDQGDALNKLSQKTGIAVEDLSKLQYAADLSGVSAEALKKGLVGLAGSVYDAASGTGPMAEKYKKLGIDVRNQDGTLKSSSVVLGELANKFAVMPDGIEKTALASDIFGKKLGAEMIPMLNGGAAGLKALADEAEALGLVMSTDLAKQSEEFNDNLEKFEKLSGQIGKSIGNALIPSLNQLMASFLEAKKAGAGFWGALNSLGGEDNIAQRLATINGRIARYNKLKAEGKTPLLGSYDDEIAALEKQQKILQAVRDRRAADEEAAARKTADKREAIERQLQGKMAELKKLEAVAAGEVSADILKTDKEKTEQLIKNAEILRNALQAAWRSSIDEAKTAAEKSKSLLKEAADIRQSGADKAADKRRSALSPEDQQADIEKQYGAASDAAMQSALLAKFAAQHGRLANAEKLAEQAAKEAERASKFAERIDDPERGARALEKTADIQATVKEAQSKLEEKKAADLEERAASQQQLIAGLDKQITELQAKAASIEVKAKVDEARGAIAELAVELAALQDKTVTVNLNVVRTWSTGSETPDQLSERIASEYGVSGSSGGYARGGYTGPGGKWQPAGIVHAGEYVLRQEVVRQPGALAFLSRFNAEGIKALKRNGYAAGGLVNNLSIPSIAPRSTRESSSGTPITLVLDGHRVPVTATSDVAQQLQTLFAREALKKGGRR